jgi:endoglucanase
MRNILDLVKSAGFNSIRVPWSNDIISNPTPGGIDYNINPDLQGLTSLQVLDYLVNRCEERGLYIILDRHRPNKTEQSELWYTPAVSEQKWIADWQSLAIRYKSSPIVIGADLHNEPHGSATWGDGNPQTDWKLAA